MHETCINNGISYNNQVLMGKSFSKQVDCRFLCWDKIHCRCNIARSSINLFRHSHINDLSPASTWPTAIAVWKRQEHLQARHLYLLEQVRYHVFLLKELPQCLASLILFVFHGFQNLHLCCNRSWDF